MAGKEYKARDKTVNKMTRDGLTEENVREGTRKRISQKDVEPPVRAAPLRSEEDLKEKQVDSGDGKRLTHNQRKESNPEKETEDVSEEMSGDDVLEQPLRMERVRETSARGSYVKGMAEAGHNRKKKMVQSYAQKKEKQKEAESLSDYKEEVEKKVKREQTVQEARKKSSRLSFEDETGMVKGSANSLTGRTAQKAVTVVSGTVHGKIHEEETDNSAVEATHKSELAAEQATRSLRHVQERRKKKAGYSDRLYKQDITSEQKGRLNFGMSEVEKNRGTGMGADAVAADGAKKTAGPQILAEKTVQGCVSGGEAWKGTLGGCKGNGNTGSQSKESSSGDLPQE